MQRSASGDFSWLIQHGGGYGSIARPSCWKPQLGERHAMESINASFLPTRSSRGRMWALALAVGLACGLVCSAYHVCLEYALEKVWFDLGPEAAENLFSETPWLYICFVCTALGALTGLLLHVLGEPLANLPGVVQAFHRDGGQLDAREIPSTAVISVCGIVAGGSLGPEAPLVAIGGGLATFIGDKAGLDRADAHVGLARSLRTRT